MKTAIQILCGAALLISAPLLTCAQSTQSPNPQKPAPATPQQSAPASPAQGSQTDKNAFPEDSTSVPVMGSKEAPVPAMSDDAAGAMMPPDDTDPVRSPEETPSSGDATFSSSTSGMDELLPDPDTGKLRKNEKPAELEHHADAKEDESVAGYYLGLKNWQAALSRYESALVTDPENPDVYWGMAEAQRNLKQYSDAKQNYLKVLAYDPDSKHAKDAKKILKGPEFASLPDTTAQSAPQKN